MQTKTLLFLSALAALILSIAIGTTAFHPQKAQAKPLSTSTRTYQVQGMVRGVDVPGGTAEIQHEAIPGFMMAMTMPFYVKDSAILKKLEPGQAIAFELVVTASDSWITNVNPIDS